jgi:hypothetical protein
VSDPLVATLAVLPLVLVGLLFVESWARRRGGPVVSPIGNAEQVTVLVILVLAILGRHHSGLEAEGPYLDQVLMGGLLVLLVVRVFSLVRALGAGLQPAGRHGPPWPFFVLPLLVYIAILPWAASERQPDGDEPYFLLISHSLVHDFDTELTNNYAEQHSLLFTSRALEPEWADPVRPDGRLYSRHSMWLPLMLAPAYAVAGVWGAMLTMALIAAVVGWLSLGLALRYWGAEHGPAAVGVWAILALTPPLLLYSHQIWVELPAALLVLVALHRIHDLREGTGTRRQWLVLGLVLVLLPLLKLRFVLLSVPLAFLAWWRSGGSRKSILWVGASLVAAIGGILLFNQLVFGKPFKDHTLAQLMRIQGSSPIDYLQGMAGLFWDSAFGLLASNPLWLLLVPAMALVIWRRSSVLIDLLICAVPYLAVVSPRREWYGAWAPPFRFGMVLLPLIALILVPLLDRRLWAGARALIAALGFLALSLLLLWVVVPGWTYNLAVGTNHLIDHLSIRLAADTGRFFPSLVRMRTASWLVPVLSATAAIFIWWLPKRRPLRARVWATAALLLGVAALPLAATHVPTGVVEFEDRQVVKQGGELYPDVWKPYRPRFRSGWKIKAGESVEAPVIAGGQQVSIQLDIRSAGGSANTATVVVHAGALHLGTWPLGTERGWQTLVINASDWPVDAGLRLELGSAEASPGSAEVILDRARLFWQ